MRICCLVLICLTVCCAQISSCGTGGNPVTEQPTSPAGAGATVEPDDFLFIQGGLTGLPEPNHEISMTGPGWYEVGLSAALAASGEVMPHDDDVMPLVALGQTAYALYGVAGFDGDNGPTSAQIGGTIDAGEYYVGFTDYALEEWVFSGPFTGSATVEIPNDHGHISPDAFVSSNGYCYLVIVVPAGGTVTLTSVELGVHGGVLGPAMPGGVSASSSDAGVMLLWYPSLDCDMPDFAGYIIERAPQFYGEYAQLNASALTSNSYIDGTAVANTAYRYRISCVDISGNCSLGRTVTLTVDPAGSLMPELVLDLPPGPVYGPVEVAFDFSGSSDPEGEPISDYTVSFWGSGAVVSGPEPVKEILMQPGCYSFIYAVTAGTRTSNNIGWIKVYPTWNDPVVISTNSEQFHRGLWLSSAVLPGTDRLLHASVDVVAEQLILFREDGAGGVSLEHLYQPDNAAVYQDPVAYHDSLLFQSESEERLQILTADASDGELVFGTSLYSQDAAGFASDGTDRIWCVVSLEDGANHHLRVLDVKDPGNSYNLVLNAGLIGWISAAYNATADCLDIVYSENTTHELYWVRDSFDGVPQVPVNINPGATCTLPTLAINPANGRPLVTYMNGGLMRIEFTALMSDLATWTAPEIIDDTLNNSVVHDMLLDDGYPIALVGLADGTLNVYRRGAVWQKTNTLPDALTTICLCTLAKVPGQDGVIVTYRDTDYQLQSFHCDPDGTNTLRWSQPGVAPHGIELHGCAGADGIHVVECDIASDIIHFVSPDGATWTPEAGVTDCTNIDIAAGTDGEVYLSYFKLGNACISWWNGGAFNLVDQVPTLEEYWPVLGSCRYSDEINFGCFNVGLSQMVYKTVHQNVVTTDTSVAFTTPCWGGIVSDNGTYTVLALGGSDPTNSYITVGEWGNDEFDGLFIGGTSLIMADSLYTKGKTMAQATYLSKEMFGGGNAFWFTRDLFSKPLRYEYQAFGQRAQAGIESFTTVNPPDPRLTVSAVTLPCATAVGLIANPTGSETHFEWSNFGRWEQLPIPAGVENMMSPELISSDDGRWHIVYRDWVTDDLMCVSTL